MHRGTAIASALGFPACPTSVDADNLSSGNAAQIRISAGDDREQR
jgi:hypothetical protein